MDIHGSGDRVTATYTRARFDQSYDPPFKADEYSGDVPQVEWERLLAAVDAEQLFRRHLPAEDRSNLADALKDTVRVCIGGRDSEKTLYNLSDRELAHARSMVKAVAGHLVTHGRHTQVREPKTVRR